MIAKSLPRTPVAALAWIAAAAIAVLMTCPVHHIAEALGLHAHTVDCAWASLFHSH